MIDDEDNDREGKKRRNELNLYTNYYFILFRHNKNLVVEIIYFRFPIHLSLKCIFKTNNFILKMNITITISVYNSKAVDELLWIEL